jgi:nucleoside-diphosphate-sugar epimerase
MKKIGIVGLGWFGLPLAESLKAKGFEVLGTTTDDDKLKLLKEKSFHCLNLNLNQVVNQNEALNFFEECNFCVINIPPSKTNFSSYENQIKFLISFLPSFCKVIFISSTGVYSDKIQTAVEDSKVLTDYNFTLQLFLTEKSLFSLLGEKLTVLRFAGLFGPNRNPSKYLAGKSDLANGKSPVNLVHLEDCIAFVEAVIENNTWGEIFNVCSTAHPSREGFYTFSCEKNNMSLPNFNTENETTIFKIVSNEKGKKRLNFKYKFDSPLDF